MWWTVAWNWMHHWYIKKFIAHTKLGIAPEIGHRNQLRSRDCIDSMHRNSVFNQIYDFIHKSNTPARAANEFKEENQRKRNKPPTAPTDKMPQCLPILCGTCGTRPYQYCAVYNKFTKRDIYLCFVLHDEHMRHKVFSFTLKAKLRISWSETVVDHAPFAAQ